MPDDRPPTDLTARVEALEREVHDVNGLHNRVASIEKNMNLYTPKSPSSPAPSPDDATEGDEEPWWTGSWVCNCCDERVVVARTDSVQHSALPAPCMSARCPACNHFCGFVRPPIPSSD